MRVVLTWFPKDAGVAGPVELGPLATVATLLERLDEAPDGLLAVRDGTPIPLDAGLGDGDHIRLVRTMSGG